MLKINIHIGDEIRKAIKDIYGKDDYDTVDCVVNDIIDRYLNAEYFDQKLGLEENNDCEICKFCGEKSKHSRMIDVDGRNLEEYNVCENCGSGYPVLE
ncbi:hypothetical protein EPN15_03775 [Patescibacteria group bacterium]|nr:MAG: hypothetical protein EPN15_03775 [Patescibacteria group bacterium]